MRLFEAIRRRKATSASVAGIAALAVAVTTMAFVYEGVKTADVQLNDGGVWVTKPTGLLLGHLNYPAQVIDGGLRTGSTGFDVLQSGDTVLLLDQSGSTLTPVNPMTVALETPVQLPPESSVSLGGKSVSLLDRDTGQLFATPSDRAGSFVINPEEPLAELGSGSAAVADVDGTVHALSPSKLQVQTFTPDDTGAFPEEPTTTEGFAEPEEGAQLTITTVGDASVVFDALTGTVTLPGGGQTVIDEAKGGVVQPTGPAADDVLISTKDSLIRQPLAGGDPTIIRVQGEPGTPAAPVYLNGCAYAAWAGSGAYLRDCAGEDDDVQSTIENLAANAELRFRVNRDVVVLNDLSTGVVYLVNQDMKKVDNWDDIAPPPEQSDSDEEEDSTEEELQVLLPDRTEENNPPTATDDDFGVRAGRTIILPVLNNDTDPDGDVLVASLKGGQPTIGTVQQILNGAALQIIVNKDAEGSGSFTYQVDDGRGGTDDATVRLTVSAEGQNSPPKEWKVSEVIVAPGQTVSQNVLIDFEDPDGDDLYVVGAATGTADQVQFRPDGQITFTSIDPNTGPKDVTVTVSDGQSETEATMRFLVRDNVAPITNNDRVVALAGERVTVAPLDNDLSPSGAPLRLAKVNETAGATIEPDYTTGTFAFTAPTAGKYYVQYLASDGPKTAEGLVFVDVKDLTDTDDPPIAVRDTAQLPTGRSTLVNVLANDTDPNGGILAVQSVQIPQESGVSVEVLEHEILRITDRGLTEPITIGYSVSNGKATAQGEVFVTPIPAPARLLPPVAEDDEVTVRVNDVATIPVLANDHHPDGDTIHLSETLIEPLVAPEDGEIFVSEDVVRFKAGPEPKVVYATYEVVDSQGQKDAGYITIRVVGADDTTNSPPRPKDVTIRALQGTSVRIPIPLNGIDPDGDSVELVGQSSAPTKGRIVDVGEAWLVYEAYPDSTGTDTFTYTVRDRIGASATATILVGIIPSSESNQAPYALKDVVSARPGRTVAVDVMANDTDPDGDPISISTNVDAPEGVQAEVEGGRVLVTAPETPGDYTIIYTISDRWGATANGTLLLNVSPDAPLAAPIARDDKAQVADVLDRATTDIDVRENDDDPDGTIDALKVSVTDPAAVVLPSGLVRITLLPTPQIITYTVTDQDGLTASAFVDVPGVDGLPPVLKPGIEAIVVNDGETVDIELSDYVLVGEGKTARITEAEKVRASNANGDNLVVDENTMRYTPKVHYDGPDALSFEVTDGTGPDDPNGKKATLVIPITVISDYNAPPTFVGASVDVAAGDGEGRLDLRGYSQDADDGDLEKLTFAIAGGTAEGVSAKIEDGSILVVSAAANAPRNPSTIDVDISDGTNSPVRGTVSVNVLSTTRNPPSATDDVVAKANQGQTVSVPVLANDYNPFPETPLTITGATVETGTGTANVDGGSVSVTPAGDFVGTMVVRYSVQDATGDPARTADARIRLTVQGRPEAPSTPTVTSIQDRTVVLSWSPPVNNGAVITGYTVTSQNGYSTQCASTTCTLSGLTNDVEYYFTVTATNEVGTSDPSPTSGPARPDARPDQPQPPILVFGDKSLAVSWVTPPTPGSAVTSYNLEISPAPERGSASRYGVTGNSLTWEGLANGTAYQVRVQAVNRAPEPSEFSAYSAFEIPAGVPDAPAAPTTSRADGVGSQSQLTVNWVAPANNGDAIKGYTLTRSGGGAADVAIAVGGGATSQTVTVPVSGSGYTFTLVARNKAGDSAASAASAPRRAFNKPEPPQNVSATGGDNTMTITFSDGALNGANQGEVSYQYSLNGGGWNDFGGSGATVSAPNNSSYTAQVRTLTSADGSSYTSDPSASSNQVTPYGPYGETSANASGGNQVVNFSWSAPARNGRDYTVQISIDGGGWQNKGMSGGSASVGAGYSETHSIDVRMVDAGGAVISGSGSSASAKSDPEPINTSVKVSQGDHHQVAGKCTHASCAYIRVTVNDGEPGVTYTAKVYAGGNYEETVTINGSGSTQTQFYWGYPGTTVRIEVTGGGKTYTDSMSWPSN